MSALSIVSSSVSSEPLIDANEASKILHLHPATLRMQAAKGEIPALKIGRVWRFRVSSLQAWMSRKLEENLKQAA